MTGLRLTLYEGGAATGRAIEWTDRLILSGIGNALRSTMGLATETGSRRQSATAFALAATDGGRPRSSNAILRSLNGLSFAGVSVGGAEGDPTAMVGHAHPSLNVATAGQSAASASLSGSDTQSPLSGRGVAEQALAGHQLSIALPVPTLPWAQLSAGRYWWGSQAFAPEVRGTRAGLKLTPLPFVEVEAGHTQDNAHGSGAYIGARLRLPLN